MSQTCTVTETGQLHLVNIISISEDRLQANFLKLLNRLNHHERLIQQNRASCQRNQEQIAATKVYVDQRFEEQNKELELKFQSVSEEFAKVNADLQVERKRIDLNCQQIEQILQFDDILKGQLEEEICGRETAVEEIKEEMRLMKMEMESISNSLETKENMVEVERIRKSVENLKAILQKIEEHQKFTEYKLEKMEILNQKADKAQKSKESQLMKEMEDKIKQQIRNSEMSKKTEQGDLKKSHSRNLTQTQADQEEEKRNSYFINNRANSGNQKLMSQINEKIDALENKFQALQERMKRVSESSGPSEVKASSNEIVEKINQIKPELIKLWAKCDSLDDKTIYAQKKMQEQGRNIQTLLDIQKESHFSKIEDKLKIFQTQIYASLKDLKSKLDGKLGLADYEKSFKAVSDRMMAITEQLLLKSDKLEVKKALLFLESKIKEIILVISEDEENERDALITKKQLKCISCDKDIEKFLGTASNLRGNWDGLPSKQNTPETLGRFGMTSYGSLAKKIRRLDGKDLPILSNKKNIQSTHSQYKPPL